MDRHIFYCGGQTEAAGYCAKKLRAAGCRFSEAVDETVTHLLLDVPCKNASCLTGFNADVIVIGGNLRDEVFEAYRTLDLLEDPEYLARNANITAHCAVKLALCKLDITLQNCPVLVIGWGRIGKCLATLLRQMGADVWVAARKKTDRAMLAALDYKALDIPECTGLPIRVVFNTVPAPVIHSNDFPADCLKIELASKPGIIGSDVIDGRRLPGRLAPESSGELIAQSILRLLPGGD
ncbi:MAG: hypothetical protein IKA47_08405 [Oscillospiraceae bacterium]|nr:hypothetical protein [Oscillospiraceae bacterium]